MHRSTASSSRDERKNGLSVMNTRGVDVTPLRGNLSTIPLESLSDNEVKNLANHILDRDFIAGPIYHSINKKLASVYIKENKEQTAIFHLAESHGCSLRHQANYRYTRILTNEKGSNEERELGSKLLEIVEFGSQYTQDGVQGLYRRLAELPSEWTIVQLTIQYDPMLRITLNPTRKHNPIHITRMSCGNIVTKMNSDKQGGTPLSILVSPSPDASDVLDIITMINDALETHKFTTPSYAMLNMSSQISSKLKCAIKDFESLLEDTRCILPGNLIDTKLHRTICREVDKIVKEIEESTKVTQSQLQLLYLLATSPFKLRKKESKLLNTIIKNSCLREKLFKAILDLHEEHLFALGSAERHPVILVLDELIDIFPIESIDGLKKYPVTRVPSVHFAQALYREHSQTIFRSGVNGESGYYIVNPAGDLKKCEKKFREYFKSHLTTWDGLFGVPPTESQFCDALSTKSVFVYCGHGGGNQYSDTSAIERVRVKAVSFLIGCSSVKIIPLGGRVEGHSIFNSYFLGGCPCTVGMLWDITDLDANRMTEYILSNWVTPGKPVKADPVEGLCKSLKDLKMQGSEATKCDLAQLLPSTRTQAFEIRNSAALVIRGLPVKISR